MAVAVEIGAAPLLDLPAGRNQPADRRAPSRELRQLHPDTRPAREDAGAERQRPEQYHPWSRALAQRHSGHTSAARSVASRRSASPSFAGPFTFSVMASTSPS